jgi:acetyltransferase-like isoleucine patch superfamily enzyme
MIRLWRKRRPPMPTPFTADDPRYADYSIGAWTYGSPDVRRWKHNGGLTIGSFCSIATGVKIMLGGEHILEWITTYPFAELMPGAERHRLIGASKGDVVIGSDVWIGEDALILSGVQIGHGAVIGARAVIAKNVPPYAVMVGNPGRLVRYRIPEAQIGPMLRIAWWDWPLDTITDNIGLLLSGDIDGFVKRAEEILATESMTAK